MNNNLKIQFDGYVFTVKGLRTGYMIAANAWDDEFRVDFIITEEKEKMDVKVTSITRNEQKLFSVWYHIPEKTKEAILNGVTF